MIHCFIVRHSYILHEILYFLGRKRKQSAIQCNANQIFQLYSSFAASFLSFQLNHQKQKRVSWLCVCVCSHCSTSGWWIGFCFRNAIKISTSECEWSSSAHSIHVHQTQIYIHIEWMWFVSLYSPMQMFMEFADDSTFFFPFHQMFILRDEKILFNFDICSSFRIGTREFNKNDEEKQLNIDEYCHLLLWIIIVLKREMACPLPLKTYIEGCRMKLIHWMDAVTEWFRSKN